MHLQAEYQEKRLYKGFGIIFRGSKLAYKTGWGKEKKHKDGNLELKVTLNI